MIVYVPTLQLMPSDLESLADLQQTRQSVLISASSRREQTK